MKVFHLASTLLHKDLRFIVKYITIKHLFSDLRSCDKGNFSCCVVKFGTQPDRGWKSLFRIMYPALRLHWPRRLEKVFASLSIINIRQPSERALVKV